MKERLPRASCVGSAAESVYKCGMQPAGRSRKRSFARDFGIASLVAVPLSIAAGYLLLAGDGAPPRPTLRSAATATLAAVSTKSAEAPAVAAVVAEAP
ncbi:MAG TPA: hypothetical protein PLV92_27485, partial [Pirellulaceae bacterium]|nr:hypothetical protein [Pirellulaceae bacterium]